MVRSMTGYGRSVLRLEKTTVTVEIRSVNHRYLDFTAKIPRSFLFLEDKLKRIVQSKFQRGSIDVFISIEGEGFLEKSLKADWELMDYYMETLKKAKDRYNLSGEIPAAVITTLPELITVQEIDNQPDDLKASILSSVDKACEQVAAMRREEGTFLMEDVKERIAAIQKTVMHLQLRRQNVIEEYRERIQSRVNDYLKHVVNIDESRIHQEIALLAEKGDITEEITRLFSHIDHFSATISTDGAVGRKLDFITQEMHREANTIGAKSMDAAISESTVSLKSEIEKIKEQLQNIE
ncbi:YicC family protein [Virgibacillus sp. C22-A2]|uniref:YicC family protein n=1 Tax=Virgibacillus tibetensis TaxID=3042313 RepID=A0ABU6KBP6_9BACI|nr:YicC family protein [Virgibacillus sp. C22-A2]